MTDAVRFHPIADEYPLLSAVELQRLAEDIQANGLLYPIVRINDLILDGRNRYLACQKAGVEPRFVDYDGATDEDSIRDYIASCNEHRRHLPPQFLEQKRAERMQRVARRRAEGATLAAIAREEGISITQVHRDLRDTVFPGGKEDGVAQPSAPATVVGKDGRRYPARKPRRPREAEGESEGESPAPPKVTHDRLGVRIPPGMMPVFSARNEAVRQELLSCCRRLRDLIQDYASSPAGEYFRRDLRRVVLGPRNAEVEGEANIRYRWPPLSELLWMIRNLYPYSVLCPHCSGTNHGKIDPKCSSCNGRGWAPARVFSMTSSTPKEYLQACADQADEEFVADDLANKTGGEQ